MSIVTEGAPRVQVLPPSVGNRVLETEIHVALECSDGRLEELRRRFMDNAASLYGHGLGELCLSSSAFMDWLLDRESVVPRLAEYVFDIYTLTDTVPMLLLADEAAVAALPP